MVLPNFAVIGAGKAGTSSLYQWLRQHPDVFMPAAIKETRFFCYDAADPEHVAASDTRFPIRTLEDYEALFAGAGDAKAIGEATPLYLDTVDAPRRIAALVPHMRLIASLRDPVSRVWSHAQMDVRQGLATDLEAEALHLADSDEHEYAPKFRRWLSHFPREQLHVFRYDDLAADPAAIVRGIFRFLDVADFEPDVGVRHNPGGVPRSRFAQRLIEAPALRRLRPIAPPAVFDLVARMRAMNAKPPSPMSHALRRRLDERYHEDIVATQELLGLDLSMWLSPSAATT